MSFARLQRPDAFSRPSGEHGDNQVFRVSETNQTRIGLLTRLPTASNSGDAPRGRYCCGVPSRTFPMGTAPLMTLYGSLLSNWTRVSAYSRRFSPLLGHESGEAVDHVALQGRSWTPNGRRRIGCARDGRHRLPTRLALPLHQRGSPIGDPVGRGQDLDPPHPCERRRKDGAQTGHITYGPSASNPTTPARTP